MTRNRRLSPVLSLLLLATCLWLSVAEARHNHEETDAAVRHRHRHRHEPQPVRRIHHPPPERRNSWSTETDYEDDSSEDREDYDDEDYQLTFHRDRNYPRSSRTSHRAKNFDARYTGRYHRAGHRGWYDEHEDRHARPRYVSRNHQSRSSRTHYPRARDAYDYEDDAEDEEEMEYARSHRFQENENKHHAGRQKSGRKHWRSWRRDWRNWQNSVTRGGKRIGQHGDDSMEGIGRNENVRGSRTDDLRRKSNSSDFKYGSRNERRRDEEEMDYYDDLDKQEDREKEEEEEDIWKEAENETEDDDEENDDDLENNYYKTDEKPPLKTYEEIIRRLTEDDPTTPSSMLKRDYRNIEFEKYLKPDAYGNLLYEPRNNSRSQNSRDTFSKTANSAYAPLKNAGSRKETGKLNIRPSDHREKVVGTTSLWKFGERQVKRIKAEEPSTKTKSLEQDYEDYLNAGADEKEEDLIKAGVEDDSAMQADVTNTDYSEDENAEENETPANNFTTSTTTTTTRRSTTTPSTTTTTTTTTTSTTTAKPSVSQHYDYNTGSQYNGYQPKNEYPPMSVHSAHKWQSLGTRESVKETRSNMQKYNKNGKSAEIREALNHAIKVSREGSCQWPRARVIPVRDVYPSPSTTYMPHCAILHRCSDDTGCCRSEALTCVPKQSHRVELYFYTTNVSGSSVVEKLSFYNHTECECREKSEYLSTSDKAPEQRFYRHYQPSTQPQNMRRAPVRKPCKCPSEFTPRITPDGQCQCNCFENDENCIRTRRGKGYFSLSDRLCIQNGECASPNCEFGEYMRLQGKCPRKRDKFDAIANYHTSLNHHRYRS